MAWSSDGSTGWLPFSISLNRSLLGSPWSCPGPWEPDDEAPPTKIEKKKRRGTMSDRATRLHDSASTLPQCPHDRVPIPRHCRHRTLVCWAFYPPPPRRERPRICRLGGLNDVHGVERPILMESWGKGATPESDHKPINLRAHHPLPTGSLSCRLCPLACRF